MQRRGTQILVMMGICLLCFVITAFAQNNNNQGGNNNNQGNTVHAPEIDMGAAAGALTIAAGTLMVLGERLRRQ